MRSLLILLAAVVLAACAHAPAPQVVRYEAPVQSGRTFALSGAEADTEAERLVAEALTRELGLRRAAPGETADYRITVTLGRSPAAVGAFTPAEEAEAEPAWRVQGAEGLQRLMRRGAYHLALHIADAGGGEVYVATSTRAYFRDRPDAVVPGLVRAAVQPLKTPPQAPGAAQR